MYKELLIFPESMKEQILTPCSARELTALATDAYPVDPAIFQRAPDGKNLQGVYGRTQEGEGWGVPPCVFFGGGKGLIRITGLGNEGVRLIDDAAPTLATAIANYLNTPYRFRINQGICTLQRSYPTLYRIRMLALTKSQSAIMAHTGPDGKFTLESLNPLIRRAIIGGLVSQARFLDEHGSLVPLEREIGTDDMIGLRILSGDPSMMRVKKDTRLHALVIHHVVFSIDMQLSGPWLAGILRSRGFGLIRLERI